MRAISAISSSDIGATSPSMMAATRARADSMATLRASLPDWSSPRNSPRASVSISGSVAGVASCSLSMSLTALEDGGHCRNTLDCLTDVITACEPCKQLTKILVELLRLCEHLSKPCRHLDHGALGVC